MVQWKELNPDGRNPTAEELSQLINIAKQHGAKVKYSDYLYDKEKQLTSTDKRKELKINKRLPKIVLPANKLKMFADWWNEDIRFEKTIPHSFEEGYLFVEHEHGLTVDKYKELIKSTAKQFHTTYRDIENQFQEYLNLMKKMTLYFKFIKENEMCIELYDGDNLLSSYINFTFGADSEPEPEIELYNIIDTSYYKDMDELMNNFNLQFIYYLITCLWYMATTAPSAKYIYEEKYPIIEHRHKGTVHVSDTKYITTPVYDMHKIRTIKIDRLITRKKGWTYSHSFQVHGHYRHYKNGKVIFIESFIKGKGKPFKVQTTILNPDKIREA